MHDLEKFYNKAPDHFRILARWFEEVFPAYVEAYYQQTGCRHHDSNSEVQDSLREYANIVEYLKNENDAAL